MQQWHFYVVMGIMFISGNLLYVIRSRRPDFKDLSQGRRFFVTLACFLAPLLFIGVPYSLWVFSGFQPGDARRAEQMIYQRYRENGALNGALKVEVHFVVKDRTTMTGYATVTYVDGSTVTANCRADKGENQEFLAVCS